MATQGQVFGAPQVSGSSPLTTDSVWLGVAGLASATATTGSGAPVRATSPTLVTPALGAATATTINAVTLDNNAWSVTTPTPTPAGGSFTATSSVHVKTIGKSAFISIFVTISNAGTGTGAVSVPLPFTSGFAAILVGRDTGLTGAALIGNIANGDTKVTITFATALTAIAITNLTVTGVCETT